MKAFLWDLALVPWFLGALVCLLLPIAFIILFPTVSIALLFIALASIYSA